MIVHEQLSFQDALSLATKRIFETKERDAPAGLSFGGLCWLPISYQISFLRFGL